MTYPTAPNQVGLTVDPADLDLYTGNHTFTSNQTLDGYRFRQPIVVNEGVTLTLTNCKPYGAGFWMVNLNGHLIGSNCDFGLWGDDSFPEDPDGWTVDHYVQIGIQLSATGSYELYSSVVHHAEDLLRIGNDCLVDGSYLTDLTTKTGAHADAIQCTGGSDWSVTNTNVQAVLSSELAQEPVNAAFMIAPDLEDIAGFRIELNRIHVESSAYAIQNRAGDPGEGSNNGGGILRNVVSGFTAAWLFDDAETAADTLCNRDGTGEPLDACVQSETPMISTDRLTRTQSSFVAASSTIGPTVTAAGSANTKGSYSQLISAAGFDAELLLLEWDNSYTASADSSSLMDIAIDPAGGTSYSVIVPNLLCGSIASPTTETGKRSLLIPVSIPAGASVAARIQSVIAGKAFRVGCRLYGGAHSMRPRVQRGPVVAYGVTVASSSGTGVSNPGSANTKGSWVNIGTASKRHAGLLVASQLNTGTVGNEQAYFDIGLDPAGGSSYSMVIEGISMASAANEAMIAVDPVSALQFIPIPSGATMAIRAQSASGGGCDIFDLGIYGF